MDLTDADVTDILALLDSLPYDEFDLETSRFRLTLRRTPDGWTQSAEIRSEPVPLTPAAPPAAGDSGPAEAAGAGETSSGPEAAHLPAQVTGSMKHRAGYNRLNVTSSRSGEEADAGPGVTEGAAGTGGGNGAGEARARASEAGVSETGAGGDRAGGDRAGGEMVAVRAPLPGTFYRAPRPGAAPFVEVGSQVGADTVIGIVETMKLMNSVHAGVAGTVAEFCVGNAEFAAHGATLLRIRADR